MLDAAKPATLRAATSAQGPGCARSASPRVSDLRRACSRRRSAVTRSACWSTRTPARAPSCASTVSRSAARSRTSCCRCIRARRVTSRPCGPCRDGSIIIAVATDAPLDHTALVAVAKRAGMDWRAAARPRTSRAATCSSPFRHPSLPARRRDHRPAAGQRRRSHRWLYEATVEATESAIDDALFSAHTVSGRYGVTYYNCRTRACSRCCAASYSVEIAPRSNVVGPARSPGSTVAPADTPRRRTPYTWCVGRARTASRRRRRRRCGCGAALNALPAIVAPVPFATARSVPSAARN